MVFTDTCIQKRPHYNAYMYTTNMTNGAFADTDRINKHKYDVDFSFCWLNLVVSW